MSGLHVNGVQRGLIARWLSALVLVLSVLAPSCRSAPSFRPKPTWREDEEGLPRAVLASECDPNTGRCHGWLPIVDSAGLDEVEVEQEPEYNRAQSIRARGADEAELWREVPAYATEVEARSVNGNQVQNAGGRLSKKDGFASRSWGAGGMPFSVLYMSPRPNHQPQTSSSGSQVEKSAESARRSGDSGRANQSNYRVATRNGGYSQQRRHYSIIPQLFISYGWGPSGK